ncbi:hypothetical protein HDU96_006653 [Phlyctochytrium bullatum]|nr:hypothetical protein HDU96_006653 [Phlyctochytrium bullatum]
MSSAWPGSTGASRNTPPHRLPPPASTSPGQNDFLQVTNASHNTIHDSAYLLTAQSGTSLGHGLFLFDDEPNRAPISELLSRGEVTYTGEETSVKAKSPNLLPRTLSRLDMSSIHREAFLDPASNETLRASMASRVGNPVPSVADESSSEAGFDTYRQMPHHFHPHLPELRDQQQPVRKRRSGLLGKAAEILSWRKRGRGGRGDTSPTEKAHRPKGPKLKMLRGVFIPTFSNIVGIIVFVRFPFIVGEAGIGHALLITFFSTTLTFLTALSMCAIVTNGRVPGGGAYYMISRSLGKEFGGSVGILFYLGQVIGAAMYILGVVEILMTNVAPQWSFGNPANDGRIYGTAILLTVSAIVATGFQVFQTLALLFFSAVVLAVIASLVGLVSSNRPGLPNGPRLLQAMAKDHIAPVLTFFQTMSKRPLLFGCLPANEPRRALFVSILIAEAAILVGSLDTVTKIVTLLYLTCYVFVNVSTTVLGAKLETGMEGALMAMAFGFIISWSVSICALIAMVLLFKYIEFNGAKVQWGDGIQAFHLQVAQRNLWTLERETTEHVKNWRPHLCLFLKMKDGETGPEVRDPEILDLVSAMKKGGGLTVLTTIRTTKNLDHDADTAAIRNLQDVLRTAAKEHKVNAFTQVLVAPSVYDGIVSAIQCTGIGHLRPNTVMLGWPRHPDEGFVNLINAVIALDKALFVVKGMSGVADLYRPVQKRRYSGSVAHGPQTVDIYWLVHDGGILTLIAHVLLKHSKWRKCQLRIFVIASEMDNSVAMKKNLISTLDHLRIEAVAEVLEIGDHDITPFAYEKTSRMQERKALAAAAVAAAASAGSAGPNTLGKRKSEFQLGLSGAGVGSGVGVGGVAGLGSPSQLPNDGIGAVSLQTSSTLAEPSIMRDSVKTPILAGGAKPTPLPLSVGLTVATPTSPAPASATGHLFEKMRSVSSLLLSATSGVARGGVAGSGSLASPSVANPGAFLSPVSAKQEREFDLFSPRSLSGSKENVDVLQDVVAIETDNLGRPRMVRQASEARTDVGRDDVTDDKPKDLWSVHGIPRTREPSGSESRKTFDTPKEHVVIIESVSPMSPKSILSPPRPQDIAAPLIPSVQARARTLEQPTKLLTHQLRPANYSAVNATPTRLRHVLTAEDTEHSPDSDNSRSPDLSDGSSERRPSSNPINPTSHQPVDGIAVAGIASPASNDASLSRRLLRMNTAVKLNELFRTKSANARLVLSNLPTPPRCQVASSSSSRIPDYDADEYLEYVDAMTAGIPRIMLVKGTGFEVVTNYY